MMRINIFILLLAFIFHKKNKKLKHISHLMTDSTMKLHSFTPNVWCRLYNKSQKAAN